MTLNSWLTDTLVAICILACSSIRPLFDIGLNYEPGGQFIINSRPKLDKLLAYSILHLDIDTQKYT